MPAFARNPDTPGICDLCGQRFLLRELRYAVVNDHKTGMRHCPSCYSPDHPQFRVFKRDTNDPQVVDDPRPDYSAINGRGEFGWNPVGNDQTYMTMSLGTVTVEV